MPIRLVSIQWPWNPGPRDIGVTETNRLDPPSTTSYTRYINRRAYRIPFPR